MKRVMSRQVKCTISVDENETNNHQNGMVVEDLLGVGETKASNVTTQPDSSGKDEDNADSLGDIIKSSIGSLVRQSETVALR